MRATYFYTYTIETGKHREHDEWIRQHGRPFWEEQTGFHDFRTFYTLVGSGPDVVTMVEFENGDQILRALAQPDAMRLWESFSAFVHDLETKILVPTTEAEGPQGQMRR